MEGKTLLHSNEDPLCCCEYRNAHGDKFHVLGFLCDCAQLDETVDLLIQGQKVPRSRCIELWDILQDRCRLPWLKGAVQIPLDVSLPGIAIPTLLWVSQFHWVFLWASQVLLLPQLYVFYRLIWRFKPRNNFYSTWALVTALYLTCVYEFQVVGWIALPKTITIWENLILVTSAFAAMYAVKSVRNLAKSDLNSVGEDRTRCRICESFVLGRDHHCFWVGCCISRSNAGVFRWFLVVTIVAASQFAYLSLTSVCETRLVWGNKILLPVKCSVFNDKFEGNPDLVFACGIHSLGISFCLLILFLKQAASR